MKSKLEIEFPITFGGENPLENKEFLGIERDVVSSHGKDQWFIRKQTSGSWAYSKLNPANK
tara:strand:- start:313 stop:495 length:183 start_codon:yes stop_codon:yes gene_type:complete